MFEDYVRDDAKPSDYTVVRGVLGQAWHVRRRGDMVGIAWTLEHAAGIVRRDMRLRTHGNPTYCGVIVM